MRRRATFIVNEEQSLDPADIQLKGRQLLHSGIKGAREERLTLGLNELPDELKNVLEQSRELHIRWTHAIPYKAVAPFVSRLVPGLHVHYTPLHRHQDGLLCSTLQSLFGQELKCDPVASTFIQPSLVSERFTTSTSFQYYFLIEHLEKLVTYIQQTICSTSDLTCQQTASYLLVADYLDIDYDSISHTLILTAFWTSAERAHRYSPTKILPKNAWPLDINSKGNDKVEVGFLTSTKATDAHELQMQGVLVVVGEDEQPKPVMFSFPSRHHLLPPAQSASQRYNVSFTEPTGLHPILEISFSSAKDLLPPTSKPEDSTCALHAYFTLPSAIFADQYAFPITTSDPPFEAAHHIKLLRSISGELDLEAPDYLIEKWGSTMLLELSTPSSPISSSSSSSANNPKPSTDTWTISIPLHLRYLAPSHSSSHTPISLPWPNVFWACTAEDGTKFPINPFDRTYLGYDTLFGPRTMFYHLPLPPAANKHVKGAATSIVNTIRVPVLNSSTVGGDHVVQWGTVVVVMFGFAWIVSKLWPAIDRLMTDGGVSTSNDEVVSQAKHGKTSKRTKVT